MTDKPVMRTGTHRPAFVSKSGKYQYGAAEGGRIDCYGCGIYLACVKMLCTKCYDTERRRLARHGKADHFALLDKETERTKQVSA